MENDTVCHRSSCSLHRRGEENTLLHTIQLARRGSIKDHSNTNDLSDQQMTQSVISVIRPGAAPLKVDGFAGFERHFHWLPHLNTLDSIAVMTGLNESTPKFENISTACYYAL